MGQRCAQQELQDKDRRAPVPGGQRRVRPRGKEQHAAGQHIAGGQRAVSAENRRPGVIVRRAGDGQAVLPLEIAHRRGGLRAENAVRRDRAGIALIALDAPQKGLQVENMAAALLIGIHYALSSSPTA